MKRETKIRCYLAVLSAAAGPSCNRSNSKQTEAHFTHTNTDCVNINEAVVSSAGVIERVQTERAAGMTLLKLLHSCRSIISLILHQQLTNECSGNPYHCGPLGKPFPMTGTIQASDDKPVLHAWCTSVLLRIKPSKQHISITDCKVAHN